MERISGRSNWQLVCRREADGVTILRARTCDREAALPDRLWDLPVRELGDHALCPDAAPAEGETVEVTWGPERGAEDWDNRKMQTLTLPGTLRRVGDYALLNCSGLRRLNLHDGIHFWGGSVLMNCRTLNTFQLVRGAGEQGESLAYFAGELSRELDVTLTTPQGEARLIFPEYLESYEENSPAHHFDYNISGAGYAYHHCFRHRQLSLRDYDGLWQRYLHLEYDPSCALKLAYYRLRYPLDLSPEAGQAYLTHLCQRSGEALGWLLERRDTQGLRFLMEKVQPDRETLSAACQLARQTQNGEAMALLLEEQHRRFSPGGEKSFAL